MCLGGRVILYVWVAKRSCVSQSVVRWFYVSEWLDNECVSLLSVPVTS